MTDKVKAPFTPGPWHIEDGEFVAYIHGGGDSERIVAEIDEAQGNQVADARLIAAAPELYEALKALMLANDHDDSCAAASCVAAKAAVAKVEL